MVAGTGVVVVVQEASCQALEGAAVALHWVGVVDVQDEVAAGGASCSVAAGADRQIQSQSMAAAPDAWAVDVQVAVAAEKGEVVAYDHGQNKSQGHQPAGAADHSDSDLLPVGARHHKVDVEKLGQTALFPGDETQQEESSLQVVHHFPS